MTRSKLENARARLKNYRERSEEAVATVVSSAVTVGSCALMSYANVKFGDANGRLQVAGIDVDLGAGLLLSLLSLASLGSAKSGKSEMATMVLGAAGNGLLCTYTANKMTEIATQNSSAQGVPRQMNAAGMRTHAPAVGGVLSRAAAEGAL